MILREVSKLSIDLPSKANFSDPFRINVFVSLLYENLFCLRSDNLYRWVVEPSTDTVTNEALRFFIERGITPVAVS